MRKLLQFVTGLAFFATSGLTGCSSDDYEGYPIVHTNPSVSVKVSEVTRTVATFTIQTDAADDFAYAIVPKGEVIEDAEALFEKAGVNLFDGAKSVEISVDNLVGDKDYMLYAAVRRVNPVRCSELFSAPIDTHIAFKDLITLEGTTTKSFSYHIMKPEGAEKYKHICVSKADFKYIQGLIGIQPYQYLMGSGIEGTEDKTYSFDTTFFDAIEFRQDIYSDMEFLIIAAPLQADGTVKQGTEKTLTFRTRKAEVAPYNIGVSVSNIASMTADVTITPEEGIETFRYYIDKKAEFEFSAFEGEAIVRRMIIGEWDDTSRESNKTITVNATKLAPNTEYQVGIVGFDKDNREKFLLYDFTTGEPTGPKPEVTLALGTVKTPWNMAAFNVKAKNTASIISGIFLKGQLDEVLSRPGNEDLTAADLIRENGVPFSPEQVQAAVSAEGLTIESVSLEPSTEYEYCVYATNEEGVATSSILPFATASSPQYDGNGVRAKLPGKYTATTKDDKGNPVTFSVTIATGVNEATSKVYHDKNRLVVLGFSPCGLEYHSPKDLIENGWASSEEEADANYGPKWFIEFNSDNTISTSAASNSELDYCMAKYDGKQFFFHGWAKKSNGKYTDQAVSFPIEVDEHQNITIKKFVDNTDFGTFEYFPGVLASSSQWYGDTAFLASEEIVLTRDAEQPTRAMSLKPAGQLRTPNYVTLKLDAAPKADSRQRAAEQLMR